MGLLEGYNGYNLTALLFLLHFSETEFSALVRLEGVFIFTFQMIPNFIECFVLYVYVYPIL